MRTSLHLRSLALSIAPLLGACGRPARQSNPPQPQQTVQLPPIPYPAMLRSANFEGVLILDLALDSLGRYDSQRSHVVSEGHPLFFNALRGALNNAARTPALYPDWRFAGVRRDTFAFILRKDSSHACPRATAQWTPICAIAEPLRRISVPFSVQPASSER